MFQHFTDEAIDVLLEAQKEANALGRKVITTEHLLIGLASVKNGLASKVLAKNKVFSNTIREIIFLDSNANPYAYTPNQLETFVQNAEFTRTLDLLLSDYVKKILAFTVIELEKTGYKFIDTEHILASTLALQREGVTIQNILRKALNSDNYIRILLLSLHSVIVGDGQPGFFEPFYNQEMAVKTALWLRNTRDQMNIPFSEFAVDLTRRAQRGELEPIVGRDTELNRLIQILTRRRKNNPILLGDPGVGKTALAEGLAQKIVKRAVPNSLENKIVLSMDLSDIMAGASYRGQFEERLRGLLTYAEESEKRVLLYIDEIHTLIGTGAQEGSMDAANMIKPALARGYLQCIGSTTYDEYRKHIARDAALERRFQPILIPEATVEQTTKILEKLAPIYELHHNLVIRQDAIDSAAELGGRYLTDRYLPDKAIDLLDEACAFAKVRSKTIEIPSKLKSALSISQKALTRPGEEPLAYRIQTYEEDMLILNTFLCTINPGHKAEDLWGLTKEEINIVKQKLFPVVTESHVGTVITDWTGIPVKKVTSSQALTLVTMEDVLNANVVGQPTAVSAVSRAIIRARAGLIRPTKPIGSFLFLGTTGVGKTELAKKLSEHFYGNAAENAMIRLDMSEYSDSHSITKLIGAGAGYVGHESGGQLTDSVRRRPYSVILFDEVEKASKKIFDVLLQVFDAGRLTDSQGRVADFTNNVIILTSNIGSNLIANNQNISCVITGKKDTNLYSIMIKECKRHFRPEFLNRLDEIIVFHTLFRDDLEQIADLMIGELEKRMNAASLRLKVNRRAKAALISTGYDPSLGARPLRRAITNLLENEISKILMDKSLEPGSLISVGASMDRTTDKLLEFLIYGANYVPKPDHGWLVFNPEWAKFSKKFYPQYKKKYKAEKEKKRIEEENRKKEVEERKRLNMEARQEVLERIKERLNLNYY
ncbi:MAG: ATP-dependent Clp protease ATP-binding subunit [Cyanobacteria bacterium P01_H01_bin.150]